MRPQNPRPYVTCSASMPCVRYIPAPEYPRLSFFNEFLFHNLCSRSCTIHTSLPCCCWFAKVSNTCLNYLQPSPLIIGFFYTCLKRWSNCQSGENCPFTKKCTIKAMDDEDVNHMVTSTWSYAMLISPNIKWYKEIGRKFVPRLYLRSKGYLWLSDRVFCKVSHALFFIIYIYIYSHVRLNGTQDWHDLLWNYFTFVYLYLNLCIENEQIIY